MIEHLADAIAALNVGQISFAASVATFVVVLFAGRDLWT